MCFFNLVSLETFKKNNIKINKQKVLYNFISISIKILKIIYKQLNRTKSNITRLNTFCIIQKSKILKTKIRKLIN